MGATLQGPWCDRVWQQSDSENKASYNNYSNDKQCQQQLLQGETQVNWFGDDCKYWKPDVQIKLVAMYCSVKIFKDKIHCMAHPAEPALLILWQNLQMCEMKKRN